VWLGSLRNGTKLTNALCALTGNAYYENGNQNPNINYAFHYLLSSHHCQYLIHNFFRIAKEHQSVFFVKERVVDAGVAAGH
jgi:hypothetical protein